MSSDLGSNRPSSRPRPDFLPPEEDAARAAEALAHEAADEVTGDSDEDGKGRGRRPGRPRPGIWWNLAMIVSAAGLLVSAFLPWVSAQVTVDAFDQTVVQDLGDAAGIEVDTMVVVVPVLALAAMAMAFWGLVAHDSRVTVLTAIPGALALLSCGIFLMRLGDARDEMNDQRLMPFDISPAYGWYVALGTALLVLGLGLVGPLVSRRSPAGAAASDRAASPSAP